MCKNILFVLMCSFYSFLNAQTMEGENFEKYFSFVKKVSIPDDILLGDVSILDCAENKNLLITDRVGRQVYLISQKGKLIKQLNVEECNPGFHWYPVYAFFNKQNEIYLINANPWGFRFGVKGECVGPMDLMFLSTYSFAFTNDGRIIGYYTGEDGNYLKEMDKLGAEIKRFGEFPEEFKNLIFRFEGGGVVTDEFDNIYQLNTNSPFVIKYNKRHKKIKEFVHYPSYYRRINKDLNPNSVNFMKDIAQKLDNKTVSENIFLIDKDKIAIQLYHKKKYPYGITIHDLEGNILIKDEIVYNKKILMAKNGYIYTVDQADADVLGNLPNPTIVIYKLKLNR